MQIMKFGEEITFDGDRWIIVQHSVGRGPDPSGKERVYHLAVDPQDTFPAETYLIYELRTPKHRD